MADGMSFKVTGGEELERAFKRLGERSNEVVMERLKRAAHSIADRMAAAYLGVSGRPVHRIYVKTGLSSRGNPFASIVVIPGADRMEINLELGTSRTEAKPWYRSTFRDTKTKQVVETEVQAAIEQIIAEESLA